MAAPPEPVAPGIAAKPALPAATRDLAAAS